MQNETQIRKNQKVIKKDKDQLVVKNFPKNKQPIIQKQKFKPPNCPTCRQKNWLEIDKCYYCKSCENINNKQKHQTDEKVLRQDRDFSTRLNYANRKIRKICLNMVNTTDNSTEDIISKLQKLNGKKLNVYKIISN